jgi:hypothetical protein
VTHHLASSIQACLANKIPSIPNNNTLFIPNPHPVIPELSCRESQCAYEFPVRFSNPNYNFSKRKPTKKQCVITTQIGARSAPYKTNVSSPRRQGRKTNNESYTKRSQAKAYKKTMRDHHANLCAERTLQKMRYHQANFYFIEN